MAQTSHFPSSQHTVAKVEEVKWDFTAFPAIPSRQDPFESSCCLQTHGISSGHPGASLRWEQQPPKRKSLIPRLGPNHVERATKTLHNWTKICSQCFQKWYPVFPNAVVLLLLFIYCFWTLKNISQTEKVTENILAKHTREKLRISKSNRALGAGILQIKSGSARFRTKLDCSHPTLLPSKAAKLNFPYHSAQRDTTTQNLLLRTGLLSFNCGKQV